MLICQLLNCLVLVRLQSLQPEHSEVYCLGGGIGRHAGLGSLTYWSSFLSLQILTIFINMGYRFTKEDIKKSNEKSVKDSTIKYFKKGTHPSNNWLQKAVKEYLNFKYECSCCKITEWNFKPVKLEIDHINGDNTDNRPENLRYLCPNCHSQTETYKGRNINSGFMKVSDQELLEAFEKEKNIRRALIKVGLSPKGGNYSRMYKLLSAPREI